MQRALRIASAQQFHAAGVGDRGRVERDHLLPGGNHRGVVPDVELRGERLVVHAGTDRVGADRRRREHDRVSTPSGSLRRARARSSGPPIRLTVRLDGEDERSTVGGFSSTTPSLSAKPIVSRCGCPGSRADVSENEIIVSAGRECCSTSCWRRLRCLPLLHAASTATPDPGRNDPSRYPCDHRGEPIVTPWPVDSQVDLHGERAGGLGA